MSFLDANGQLQGDVIATNINQGDDLLNSIFGTFRQIGAGIQKVSNDWAALSYQNRDIEEGRWTLNNAVYQFQQLSPIGQLAIAGSVAYVVASLIRKG